MADSQDLYRTLGVAKGASADEIRRAYRKLARENHPDLKPGDKAAEERFKKISSANDVLGDSKKRALYDEFGEQGLREGFDVDQARTYARYGGGFGGGGQSASSGGGFGFDVGDLFGDFFGGRGRQAQAAPGQDLSASVELNLDEALAGKEISLQLPVGQACSTCRGTGRKSGQAPKRCGTCRGAGQVDMGGGRPGMPKARCPSCQGSGQQAESCSMCAGHGQVQSQRPVTVRIPPGADHGSKLRVTGRGAPGKGGPGDLHLSITVRSHPWFRREGLNLIMRLPLTVAEACCGTQVTVPTITGTAQLKIAPGTQSGTRLRMRGKGVAKGGKQGDLLVEVEVRVPETISPEGEAAARTLEALYQAPVRQGLKL
jgi:molecular chaperone DnaJ